MTNDTQMELKLTPSNTGVTKLSQVEGMKGRLVNSYHILNEKIDLLHEQLFSVLRLSGPEAAKGLNDTEVEEEMVPLADFLKQQNDHVIRLSDLVDDILDRLEL